MKPDDINSYDQLAKLTVPRLRELAAEDTELTNATGLDKPALVEALAKVYGFETPKQQNAVVIKKLKKQMKKVKKDRDSILEAQAPERDQGKLKTVRREIRLLKRQMRRLAKAS
jgi:hypothetical protein